MANITNKYITGRDPNKPIAICLNAIEDIHTYAQVQVLNGHAT